MRLPPATRELEAYEAASFVTEGAPGVHVIGHSALRKKASRHAHFPNNNRAGHRNRLDIEPHETDLHKTVALPPQRSMGSGLQPDADSRFRGVSRSSIGLRV